MERITGCIAAAIAVGWMAWVTPAPAATLFTEDFNGAFLGEAWQVIDDSPDMRALDEGKLSVVTETGSLSKGKIKNLLLTREALTAKNADIALKFEMDIQSYGGDWASRAYAGIIMQVDAGSFMAAYVTNYGASYNSDTGPYGVYEKRWKGSAKPYLLAKLAGKKTGVMDFFLKIEKRSYKYAALFSLDGEKWKRLGTFAILNSLPKIGLIAYHGKNGSEAIVAFDDFKISEVK